MSISPDKLLQKIAKLLFGEIIILLGSIFILFKLTNNIPEASKPNLQLLPHLEAKIKNKPLFLLTEKTLLHVKKTHNLTDYLSKTYIFSKLIPKLDISTKGNAAIKSKNLKKINNNLYDLTLIIKPTSNYYPKFLELKYNNSSLFIPFILPQTNNQNYCIKNATHKIYFMPGINRYLILTNEKDIFTHEMPYIYYFCNNKFIIKRNPITNAYSWKKLYNKNNLTIYSSNDWLKFQITTRRSINSIIENTKLIANKISITPYLFFYDKKNIKLIYVKKSKIYNLVADQNIHLKGNIYNQEFNIKLKNPYYIKLFNIILTKRQVIFILISTILFIINIIIIKVINKQAKITTKKNV